MRPIWGTGAPDEPILRELRAAVHDDVSLVFLLKLDHLLDHSTSKHGGVVPLGVLQGQGVPRETATQRPIPGPRPRRPIETSNPRAADAVKESDLYEQIERAIRQAANDTFTVTATNPKRMGPVDHSRNGSFLINYFVAEDTERMLAVWEYTAGWWEQETGLDNSTVLLPREGEQTDYAIINHCRWYHLWELHALHPLQAVVQELRARQLLRQQHHPQSRHLPARLRNLRDRERRERQ